MEKIRAGLYEIRVNDEVRYLVERNPEGINGARGWWIATESGNGKTWFEYPAKTLQEAVEIIDDIEKRNTWVNDPSWGWVTIPVHRQVLTHQVVMVGGTVAGKFKSLATAEKFAISICGKVQELK